MAEEQARDSGPGWGQYAAVFVLLALVMAGLRLKERFSESEEATSAEPRNFDPRRAPVVPDEPSSASRKSLQMVRTGEGIVGAVESELDVLRANADADSARRLGALMESRSAGLRMSGTRGPSRAGGRLIRDRSSWRAFWRSVGGHDIPDPDFSDRMGVAVFGGTLPGGSEVSIVSEGEESGRYVVRYSIRRGRGKDAAERPYEIAVVGRSNLSPRFVRVD